MIGHLIEDCLIELGLSTPCLNQVLKKVFSEKISSSETQDFILLLDCQESILHPGRFAYCELDSNDVVLSWVVFERFRDSTTRLLMKDVPVF